jgi:hypothetical protein
MCHADFFQRYISHANLLWSTEKWKTLVFLLICDASITPTHQPKHGKPKLMQKNSNPQKDRKVISYQIVIHHFFFSKIAVKIYFKGYCEIKYFTKNLRLLDSAIHCILQWRKALNSHNRLNKSHFPIL